jgi:hypothetical protein
MATLSTTQAEWTVQELKAQLDREEAFFHPRRAQP